MFGFEQPPASSEGEVPRSERELDPEQAFLELQYRVADELFPDPAEFKTWIEGVTMNSDTEEIQNGQILRDLLESSDGGSSYVERYMEASDEGEKDGVITEVVAEAHRQGIGTVPEFNDDIDREAA